MRPRLPRPVRPLAALGLATGLTVALTQSTTTASFTATTADSGNQVSSAPTFCTSPGSTSLTVAMDAAVYQSNPNTNYGATASIGVGSANSANAYSFMKFTLPALPAYCTVTAATLSVRASTPTAGAVLNVYRADAAWNGATLTWNTVGRPGFTGTPATTNSLASAGVQQWDVKTLTQQLYAGPDYGFALKDSVDNAASARYQTWDSLEATTAANRPKLDLTWG